MIPPSLPTVEGLVIFSSLGVGLFAVSVLERFGFAVNESAVKFVLAVLTVVGLGAFMFLHPFFASVLVGF